jgi:hypothetical protein
MPVDTESQRETARVDFLVDETGARVGLPDDTPVTSTGSQEQAVGGTGPSLGWRVGLLALVAVVGLLLIAQFFAGGAGTAVIPGTPTVAPAEGTPPAAAGQGG